MAYIALYRKFRPQSFSEMVGQEHITRTLKNQIVAGRVGHAYLFNGGRGTGKTSAAKVLARAINCLEPKDGEPCNECEICKASLSGSLTDIVEMDAASNNSVEDIRQIRDEVNFLPTLAKYRVYIIDEVHMLSTGAFNALLKTLEEPPAHVKFILATTEPQKLPATILSRCQRFDFKKISNENIAKRLKFVCDESNIEITKEALKMISVLAEGAMRDGLSILERCLQDGTSQIDEEKIRDLVGIPKLTYIHKILDSIINFNVEESLATIEEILKEGKDLQNLLWEMVKYCKDILVYKTSKNLEIYSEEEIKLIDEIEKKASKERLLNIIYELSNLENDMKWSTQKTILFQVGIIKLCNNEVTNTASASVDNLEIASLTRKINALEQKIEMIGTQAVHKKVQNVESTPKNTPSEQLKQTQTITKKAPVNLNDGEKLQSWPKIVTELKQSGKIMLYTNLMNTEANKLNDMTVGISFPKGLTPFGKTILEKSENISEIEKRVSMELGKPMRIKIIDEKVQSTQIQSEANPIEALAQDMDIPFNIIE